MKPPDYLARLRRASIIPLVLASSIAAAQFAPQAACSAGDTDGDGIPDCVELSESLNPAVKDNDVFASGRLFAMQQYRDFLAREGDVRGIDYWSSQIAGSYMSRGQTIDQFMGSLEFETNAAAVTRLYFAYFQRVPDYQGLNYWIRYAAAGNSLATISEAFAESDEFLKQYGGQGNRQFVELVYNNVLARPADAEGLAYWTSQLNNRTLNWGQVMLAFTELPEYRLLIRNETLVTLTYVAMLRRTPDSAGFSSWLSYLDRGNTPLAFIDQVLEAPEYHSRFLN